MQLALCEGRPLAKGVLTNVCNDRIGADNAFLCSEPGKSTEPSACMITPAQFVLMKRSDCQYRSQRIKQLNDNGNILLHLINTTTHVSPQECLCKHITNIFD